MTKLLICADPAAPHTQKWVNGLAEMNYEILLFGFSNPKEEWYNSSVRIESVNFSENLQKKDDGAISKVVYVKALSKLRELLREFKPDILHAHYATSYALLCALTNYHPMCISVWGNDVFVFPNLSILHKKIFQFNLNRADKLFSTSKIMAKEILKYTNKNIAVIPFGIDTKIFSPGSYMKYFAENDVVIGTVKTMEEKYGIEYLINAFSIVSQKLKNTSLKLLIVGGGRMLEKYKKLVADLDLVEDTVFTGRVDYKTVPDYHRNLSIAVYPSTESGESFGVSVLESSACAKPVIASNIGGLPEVVVDGVTGFLVEPKNIMKLSEKIEKLVVDEELRTKMGDQGRKFVIDTYSFEKNLNEQIQQYDLLLRNV